MADNQNLQDFRVIIAGGRDFNNYELLKQKADRILSNIRDTHHIIIVSGTARGADSLGEQYAKENHFAIERHPAKWDVYGKSAGYRRNAEMADVSDALIAFWDGMSRGTMHMINLANAKHLEVRVIRYHKV